MIRCGHCKGAHPTVAAVRKCSATPNVPKSIRDPFAGLEEMEREMHRMEAEADRAESERDAANKAAKWDAEARGDFRAKMRTDAPSISELVERVSALLASRQVPEGEWRWSRAVRAMISGSNNNVTPYALKTAIARLESYPVMRVLRKKVEHEGLYKLSRDVRIHYSHLRKGQLVQVLRGKDSNQLYAKTVNFTEGKKRPTLTYVKGLIFELWDSELVPLEEAQELTRKTGWCIFGHFLTNPKSIARGMGDICYSRYPHLALNQEAS